MRVTKGKPLSTVIRLRQGIYQRLGVLIEKRKRRSEYLVKGGGRRGTGVGVVLHYADFSSDDNSRCEGKKRVRAGRAKEGG